jgi:hypothetical protein
VQPSRTKRRAETYESFRARVQNRINERTGKSVSAACRMLDYPIGSLERILREGLPQNPHVKTIEKLDALGILDLVRARAAS